MAMAKLSHEEFYELLKDQINWNGTDSVNKALQQVSLELNLCTIKEKLPSQPHPTEEKYPEQTKRFREILEEMYQTHLTKNADYSPYNILVTGMKGCVTRLWDKSARFFNLMGLDIGTYTWNEEKLNSVRDESVNDTLLDWANYCIITRIFREGKWGK